jgi:putative ABC transport system permease protein
METLLQDIRYGLRMLTRSPGFAAISLLMLALGIGTNTAMFSIVDAVLLRPLPYEHAERLVRVWQRLPDGNFNLFSTPDFNAWNSHAAAFDKFGAHVLADFSLTGNGEAEPVQGARVSAEFFPTMEVHPYLGRTFFEDEDRPGAGNVVVLSFGLWQRRFGADPAITGKQIVLNGASKTVIGVMPQNFDVLETGEQLWVPLQLDPTEATASARGVHWLGTIARLRANTDIAQTQSKLDAIAAALRQQDPQGDAGRGVVLYSLRDSLTGQVRPALLLLFGAVGFVLLLATANVANLLLARAADRKKEIAVRMAMGASRARLVRQLLTESVVLSILGGALALGFAGAGLRILVATNPVSLPRLNEIGLQWPALVVALVFSTATGLLFGIMPAFRASRECTSDTLKEGSRGSRRTEKDRGLLVVAEMALTVILLVAAGLSLKSLWVLLSANPGFDAQNVLTMQVALPEARYTGEQIPRFYGNLLDRLKELPQVHSFAIARDLPLAGANPSAPVEVEGQAPAPPGETPTVRVRTVSSRYFETLGIALLAGRDFIQQDAKESPIVAIVSRSLAEQYWPAQNPIGKRIKIGLPGLSWASVIGVVNDVKHIGLEFDSEATAYFSYSQIPTAMLPLVESSMQIAFRSSAAPASLVSAVRARVRSLDPDISVSQVQSMEEIVATSLSSWRFNMFLLGGFALLALALAMIGTYGVLAHSVSRRTQEIGIRMALGARPGNILRLILGEGLRLILIGLAIGLAGALNLGRVLSSLLYGVRASDPGTFLLVASLLTVIALAACYIPAHRAAGVAPMVALRHE